MGTFEKSIVSSPGILLLHPFFQHHMIIIMIITKIIIRVIRIIINIIEIKIMIRILIVISRDLIIEIGMSGSTLAVSASVSLGDQFVF